MQAILRRLKSFGKDQWFIVDVQQPPPVCRQCGDLELIEFPEDDILEKPVECLDVTYQNLKLKSFFVAILFKYGCTKGMAGGQMPYCLRI